MSGAKKNQRESKEKIARAKKQQRTRHFIRARRLREHAAPRSALVQFAHGVFDMLTQEATLVGRHMAVAATLIEIGGNG
ncbi:hypothetical protein VSR34_34250 [Paraburkholderia sp. JHI2823]|uniref:hypothetical protein n=1 Tax=Paraburkholderia sp. JHI2823 TaxID=3112960 RepID=UPI0031747C23